MPSVFFRYDDSVEKGVFDSLNLAVYSYGHQNPVKFLDPDGNDVYSTTAAIPIFGPLGVKASVDYDTDTNAFSHPVVGPSLMVGPQFKFMPKFDLGVSTKMTLGDDVMNCTSLNVDVSGGLFFNAGLEASINPNNVTNNNINLNQGVGLQIGPSASISMDYDLDAIWQGFVNGLEKLQDPKTWLPDTPLGGF